MEDSIDEINLDIQSYIHLKSFDALLFNIDNDAFGILDSFIEFDSYCALLLFKEYIVNFEDIFNEDIKNRVYEIINFFRNKVEYDENEKENAIEICNDIIRFVNLKNGSELKKYIYEELRFRGCIDKEEYLLLRNNHIHVALQRLRLYYAIDYYVLGLLLDIFDEEQIKCLISILLNFPEIFMHSINNIIGDCPELLCNEKNRTIIKIISVLLKEKLHNLVIGTSNKKVLKKEYSLYKKKLRKVKINID